ncbi:MAG: RNA 2',3'-cyclic phosphodiesterase [Clostridiales bacterium]|nr:RNA 2',3'-cyclic phosphodiesterase [Clostridiales bacterium]
MRLFIAINFDEETKERLWALCQKLRPHMESVRFTHRQNLHLTVIFLGEVAETRLSAAKLALAKLEAAPFSLRFGGLGAFSRPDGDILWLGLEEDGEGVLAKIYNFLYYQLTSGGFAVEKREYTPHLTLAREVFWHKNFIKSSFASSLPSFEVKVGRVSLMKSGRIAGLLTYTELFGKDLRE